MLPYFKVHIKPNRHISILAMLIFVLNICFNTEAFADIKFKSLKVKDGLSHSNCTSIIKDSEGFMWIGTYDGLNRFDGYECKVFKHSEEDSMSICHNAIQDLFIDHKGDLWIGTNRGLNKYNYKTETFKHYLDEPNTITRKVISSICEDKQGNIYCGLWGDGLYVINRKDDTVKHIDLAGFHGLTPSSELVRKVICDTQDNIWICTWGDGLVMIEAQTREIIHFKSNKSEQQISNYIWSIMEDDYGRYYVVSARGGFYSLNLKDRKLKVVDHEFQTKLSNTDIIAVGKDNKDNIWIGTQGKGAFKYSKTSHTFSSYSYDLGSSSSLNSNRIDDFYQDPNNQFFWVTTANGVNYVDPWANKFNLVGEADFPENTVSSECLSFVEVNNELLIGTWGNGIIAYDYNNNKFTKTTYKKPQISDDLVYSITLLNGNIYAGTRFGLNIINTKNNKTVQYHAQLDEEGKLGNNYVRHLFVDNQNRMWLGTDAGLESFNPKDKTFKLFKPYPNVSPEVLENLVWTINQDDDGFLYIGTEGGGICKFDPKSEKFIDFINTHTHENSGLPSNRVISTFKDSKQRIWMGTADGLCLFDSKKGTFTTLGEKDGLNNTMIFSIEEDIKHRIWFSTAKSIVKLNPETWEFNEFYYGDGVQQKEFSKDASTKLSNGYLVFGGLGGFNIFHPDSIKYNTTPPIVAITGIQIFNQDIYEYQRTLNKKLINQSVNHIKRLQLKYTDNSISIRFAALDYTNPYNNKYQYRLVNFDKNWINNGAKRSATYTNLPPGKYRFEVRAANSDGYWSDGPRQFDLFIKPPFHATLGFRAAMALLLICSTIIFFRLRTNQLKRQNDKLEKLVINKTKGLIEANKSLEEKQEEIRTQNEEILKQRNELHDHKHHLEDLVDERTKALEIAKNQAEESEKLKSAFLANISHEIRTPMNAIIGFTTLLGTSDVTDEEKKQFIEYIRSNGEILLILIDDLLDLSRIESGILKINEENIDLFETIRGVTNPYMVKIKAKGLHFQLTLPDKTNICNIISDPTRIQQILRNLIENAIKFTETGFIEVGLQPYTYRSKSYIKIYVKDSGMGIPTKKQHEIFKAFKKLNRKDATKLYEGTGLGLTICKNLVKMLGGKIWVESIEGEFSTFNFTLPVDHELLDKIF